LRRSSLAFGGLRDWNATEHAQPQQPNSAALFVSTALSCWKTDRPDAFNRDVQINDTAYRRLDPEYYAWLRSRMNMAKLAVLAGQLAQESFDGLRAASTESTSGRWLA